MRLSCAFCCGYVATADICCSHLRFITADLVSLAISTKPINILTTTFIGRYTSVCTSHVWNSHNVLFLMNTTTEETRVNETHSFKYRTSVQGGSSQNQIYWCMAALRLLLDSWSHGYVWTVSNRSEFAPETSNPSTSDGVDSHIGCQTAQSALTWHTVFEFCIDYRTKMINEQFHFCLISKVCLVNCLSLNI